MRTRRVGKYRFEIAGTVFWIILAALLAAFCGWLWNHQRSGCPIVTRGREWMVLSGDQMEPALPDGSLLLLEAGREAFPGDAVVLADAEKRSVWRLLEQTGEQILVKKDRALQSSLHEKQELTHVVACGIPLAGFLLAVLMTGKGLALAEGVLGFLFLFAEISHLIRKKFRARSRTVPAIVLHKRNIQRMEDRMEHVVDVTEQYLTPEHSPYRSVLQEEMDKIRAEKTEAPAEEPAKPAVAVLIDGQEAASLPLDHAQTVSVKQGEWRIDITITQNDGAPENISCQKMQQSDADLILNK